MFLRPITPADMDNVREWRNRPEVSKYLYTDDYITPEIHEKWFHRILEDPSCRYWIIQYGDQGVGVANICDISERNRRCFWAYYIADPSLRGKGLGAIVEFEILNVVFDEMKINRLCCEVFAFNELVISTHEHFGFRVSPSNFEIAAETLGEPQANGFQDRVDPKSAAGGGQRIDRFVQARHRLQVVGHDDQLRVPIAGRFTIGGIDGKDQLRARAHGPLDFHRKVRKEFLRLPEFYPRPVEVIDASRSAEEVHETVWETLQRVRF